MFFLKEHLFAVLTLENTAGRWADFWMNLMPDWKELWWRGGLTGKTSGPFTEHCTPWSTLFLVKGLILTLLTKVPRIWFKNFKQTISGERTHLTKWDDTSSQLCTVDFANAGDPNWWTWPSHWWITSDSGGVTLSFSITPNDHVMLDFGLYATRFPLQCWWKLHNCVDSMKVTGPVSSKIRRWDTSKWRRWRLLVITKNDRFPLEEVWSIVFGFLESKSWKIPILLSSSPVRSMPRWPCFVFGSELRSSPVLLSLPDDEHSLAEGMYSLDTSSSDSELLSKESWSKSATQSGNVTLPGKDWAHLAFPSCVDGRKI